MWVLDGGKNALFAYDLATGELIAEYALDSANNDPRGLWSDGVTIWVSDHGAKRLFAYRIVAQDTETATGEDEEAAPLERVRDEEFANLSRASNNSPRGIWSDGDVMYVADESDGKVYSYNLPDAIDARLATLTLSGVDFGEFLPGRTEYDGVAAEGVTETTVEAAADAAPHQSCHRPGRQRRRRGERPPGHARGDRGGHGHGDFSRQQPYEGLPCAVRRDAVGPGARSLAALPARRHLRRVQPRRLRGGQRRGAGQPARRAGTSRPSTPCTRASTSPTSSGRRTS